MATFSSLSAGLGKASGVAVEEDVGSRHTPVLETGPTVDVVSLAYPTQDRRTLVSSLDLGGGPRSKPGPRSFSLEGEESPRCPGW